MSAAIDRVVWSQSESCDVCSTTFVYQASDVMLDVQFLDLIVRCPECGSRVVAEAPTNRKRELLCPAPKATASKPSTPTKPIAAPAAKGGKK